MHQSEIQRRLSQLAERLAMPQHPVDLLQDDRETAFLRNRAFIRSGKDWLIKEAINWAAANQGWVELICDEYGNPYDLKRVSDDDQSYQWFDSK